MVILGERNTLNALTLVSYHINLPAKTSVFYYTLV